jgi:hypothetical protein
MKVSAPSELDLGQRSGSALPIVTTGNEVRFPEIRHRGVIFRLKESLVVPYFYDEGLFYCQYKPLSILSFGNTLEDAARSFQEDFAMMWDSIAKAPDKSLSPEAKQVKINMKALVGTVAAE